MSNLKLAAPGDDAKPVIQLGTDAIQISTALAKYKDVTPKDTATLKELTTGIAVFRSMRKIVTDTHAEKKAPILEEGRALDAEKNRLLGLIKDAETPLIEKKDAYEAEKEKIKKAKEEAETKRIAKIQARINSFGNSLVGIHNKTAEALHADLDFINQCISEDEFEYKEFSPAAEAAKLSTQRSLAEALKSRLQFEAEQLEAAAERIKLEAERKAIEDARIAADAEIEEKRQAAQKIADDKKAEEEAKIAAQYKELQEKKDAQEAKRLEDAKIMAAELKKIDDQKKEAAAELEKQRLAKIEAEEKARKERQALEDRVRNAAPELLKQLGYALDEMGNLAGVLGEYMPNIPDGSHGKLKLQTAYDNAKDKELKLRKLIAEIEGGK